MRSLLTMSHANSSRAKLCGASCNKVAVSSNLRQVPALNGLWAARRSSNAVFVHDRADRNPPGICRFLLARQALTRFFLSLTRGLSLPLISLGTDYKGRRFGARVWFGWTGKLETRDLCL